nr:hypothetical protein [Tanacetum cinerariifolium]
MLLIPSFSIKKLNLSRGKDTPMLEKTKLDKDLHGTPVDATLYRSMIGSLISTDTSYPPVGYDVLTFPLRTANLIDDDRTKRLYLRYPKNCISNYNEGRMIERNFIEIQGTYLVKIRDNTFNEAIKENVFEHINKFLEVVGPIKINGVSQDRFRLSIFPISLAGAVGEWFKMDCIGSITTWEYLVEKFIQKFYQPSDDNGEIEAEEDDDPNDITDIFKIEGNLFDFETPLSTDTSSTDTSYPPVGYDVLTFPLRTANYDTSNAGTQDNQGHEERRDDPTLEPSVCKIRRFEMMKYSFNADEEYIAIKESEYLNNSKDNLDAYRELLRIIDEGWVMETHDE